jgi:two-component system, OmpR family, KDP operon response regulator KdpE
VTDPKPKVLVVDDEPALARALAINLRAHGWEVVTAADGRSALDAAATTHPDVVVLDLGLPDLDGTEVIAGLRGWTSVPIVVLSARQHGEDKVEALDLGADDYVSKPFSVPELLARVRVALRHGEVAENRAESTRLERGVVHLDLAEHTARVRGEAVPLTRTQFALLACFARHPGRLLTHRAIVAEVWGDPDAAAADNLRVQISQLRRRIEEDPRHPALIVTEPGLGYRFFDGQTEPA